MISPEFSFKSKVWKWKGHAAWHFVSIPKKYSRIISDLTSAERRGFGSVKVEAKTKSSTWETSIFPDKKSGCYLLPIKKIVRAEANLKENSVYQFNLKIKL